MTSIVWFSHPPDYGKLAVSVAKVRELDPSASLHVCIESSNVAPSFEGVEIIRRDFFRGTHLDGVEAVHGVSRTLTGIDADMLVKIDSDMIPNQAFWLEGATVFQRWNNFYVGLYALPREAIATVARCLEDQPNPGIHEAIAICSRGVVACYALKIPINHIRLPKGEFVPDVLRPAH